MLKLKYSFLENKTAREAMIKLSTTNSLPADIAYRVGRIATRIDKEIPKMRDLAIQTLKKHAVLNEIGMPKGMEKGDFQFENDTKKAACDAEFNTLMESEIEEKVLPIPLSALQHVGLTPTEIVAIEAIIDVNL